MTKTNFSLLCLGCAVVFIPLMVLFAEAEKAGVVLGPIIFLSCLSAILAAAKKLPAPEEPAHAEPSTARVFSGFCSFLLPGLGQLLFGRLLPALTFCVLSVAGWGAAIFIFNASSWHTPASAICAALTGVTVHIISAYFAANK